MHDRRMAPEPELFVPERRLQEQMPQPGIKPSWVRVMVKIVFLYIEK
jgi:hypothetical protein